MITLDVSGNDRALKAIMAGKDKAIYLAMKRAVRKTVNWLKRQLATSIAKEVLLPNKAINPRVFHGVDPKHLKGNIWIGLIPVSAHYAGAMSPSGTGAKAGKHYFEGGFIASPPSNTTKTIWTRSTRARLPIKREKIEIDEPSMTLINRFERQAETYFSKQLTAELNFALNHEKK